jgi:branched-chain amino acid transport system substrate-binding protein
MTSSNRITRRQFAGGALAGAAIAAAGFPMPAIAQAKPLKIGILLPRSGYLAAAGQSCWRGVEVGAPVLAELGMPVEPISGDFESNVDLARARTESLISNGAQVIVGAFDSGGTLAAAQVCEQHGIPLVVNVGAAPQITEQGYKTVFRNFVTSVDLIRDGMKLMKDTFDAVGKTPKTAVFLHANDTFGEANRAALDQLWPSLNMPFQILDKISYDPRAKDLGIEVTKAKATGAELALVTTRASDAILLVREMVKQKWEPMGIMSPGSPGMYDEGFYKTLGKRANYAITNVPWYISKKDLTKKLIAGFAKRYPNDQFAMHGFNIGVTFEAMLVAADAYKRAGSADPAKLLAALRETNIADHVMTGGPIQFDAKGQNRNITAAVVQNLTELPTLVLPKDAAEAAPVFPMPGWDARG